MSSVDWRLWIDVIIMELKRAKGGSIAVAVTLRSSVRFAGKVTKEPTGFLTLKHTVDKVDKTTYIALDQVDAIEVL